MIPAGVQVYVAATPVDFRKGANGLMGLVRDGGDDPFNSALCELFDWRASSGAVLTRSGDLDQKKP